LESLDRATTRLGIVDRCDVEQVDSALSGRAHAIDAITAWVAAEHRSSRLVNPEVAGRLTKDLETGADFVLRLALDRETGRLDLVRLGRQLHMLRSLAEPNRKPNALDCLG
jgi:hypothetical protein